MLHMKVHRGDAAFTISFFILILCAVIFFFFFIVI